MQKTKAVIALQGSQHWTVVSKQRKLISTAIQPRWILKGHGKILSTAYCRTSVRHFFSVGQGKRSWKLPQVYSSNPECSSKKWETASHTAQPNHYIQRHRYTLPSLAGAWGNELSPFSQAVTDFRKVPLEIRPMPLFRNSAHLSTLMTESEGIHSSSSLYNFPPKFSCYFYPILSPNDVVLKASASCILFFSSKLYIWRLSVLITNSEKQKMKLQRTNSRVGVEEVRKYKAKQKETWNSLRADMSETKSSISNRALKNLLSLIPITYF